MTFHGAMAVTFALGFVFCGLYVTAAWLRSLVRDARYWRRFEAAMDNPANPVVMLGEVERMKAEIDARTDQLIRGGLLTMGRMH